PIDDLTTQTFIGWGVGNVNDPPDNDESRVYVTAPTTTTLFVDFDQDKSEDLSVFISPFHEVPIVDPDHDLTGASLFTKDGVSFATAWGQDETASPALPSIDVGTGVVPVPSLLVQKTIGPFIDDRDCSGSVTLGDGIRYQVRYFNNSVNPIPNIIVEDNLPPQVAYIPNSTQINGAQVADDAGSTPFLFDNGGFNIGDLEPLEIGNFTFDVRVIQPTSIIANEAKAQSKNLALASDSVFVFAPFITTTTRIYDVDLAVVEPANAIVEPGQVVTYNLTITNTNPATFTVLAAHDLFDAQALSFQAAMPAPDTVEADKIAWNDLTDTFGDLAPNASLTLVMTFIVRDSAAPATEILNRFIGNGGRQSNNTLLPICNDEALIMTAPIQQPTATPAPTKTPVSPGAPLSTSTPGPTPTPTTTPTAVPTGLPVVLLPETGLRPPLVSMLPLVVSSGAFVLLAVVLISRYRRRS
ncbi:MAG: hypothetical protein R3264_10735, partial [Anaerolineae bacterium]|nr:hypothetical protein [Anaerolineae bacterium]